MQKLFFVDIMQQQLPRKGNKKKWVKVPFPNNGRALRQVDEHKDLGIILDPKLSKLLEGIIMNEIVQRTWLGATKFQTVE